MIKRRRLSTRDRVALFNRKGGICHLCGLKVMPGEDWDNSHEIPLEMGGADDESNWNVAHRKCHRVHTATVDAPRIAKTKRQYARHIGAEAEPVRKIKSPGFHRPPKQNRASTPLTKAIPRQQGIYK